MDSSSYHIPVLMNEVLHYLITNKSGTYVDCTMGGGGHSLAILERLNNDGKLIGIDRDEEAIVFSQNRLKKYQDQLTIVNGNFSMLGEVLGDQGGDGILMDLGVSSYQIDTATRGFSYQKSGPIDMRMNKAQKLTAKQVVNESSQEELVQIFKEYGEEWRARSIAANIIKYRKINKIISTEQLAKIISGVVPFKHRTKSLSRIFQALRIHINQELSSLSQTLNKTIPALKTGGRLVVISYHSLEDRIVKKYFNKLEKPCTCPPRIPMCICLKKPIIKMLTRRAIKSSSTEIDINPRSRSARLRAVEKI